MITLYTLVIRLYYLAVFLASVWNPKASKFIKGRKSVWHDLESIASKYKSPVWFHCSSLGEFEQGRSLIEKLKQSVPSVPIILTFFSPSGYDVRKNYPLVDAVCYLPMDTPFNARRFVRLLSPRLAVFIKYDFWFNYLRRLNENNIPFIFIAVKLQRDHYLFRTLLRKFLQILGQARYIFTQDRETADLLMERKISRAVVAGDPRIDRVLDIASTPTKTYLTLMKSDQVKTLVLGSIWPDDWKVLRNLLDRIDPSYRMIIAPHDISGSFIKELVKDLHPRVWLLSQLTGQHDDQVKHILVDSMGDLAYLYRYGELAYVGGGFGTGLHNILEPAIYGIPVLFGPNYKRFKEAVDFINMGVGRRVENVRELEEAILHFDSMVIKSEVKNKLNGYFEKHKGATDKIFSYLLDESLL